MAEAVYTAEKRVTLVKGWLTGGVDPADGSVECGDGTAYPLEVTIGQLAEIYYRVRDSIFSGAITETYNDGVNPASYITLGISGTPATNLVEYNAVNDGGGGSVNYFVQRGYSTEDVVGWGQYFGEPYTVTFDGDGSPSPPPSIDYYDANKERAVWIPDIDVGFNSSELKTGYSHNLVGGWYGGADFTYSGYRVYHDIDNGSGDLYVGDASLIFGNQIAWLDENGSGNPFDPLNKLYISLQFDIYGIIYTGEFWSTLISPSSIEFPMGVNLEIKLQTGDVITCPLYSNRFYPDPNYYYTGAIRVAATEWWPYAKGAPATPVWNTGTGAKL